MNYTDCALDAARFAALNKTWRKTAWRLKLLKAAGAGLPVEPEITKLDRAGAGSIYPLDAGAGKYKKMIHDSAGNRTFILTGAPLTGSDAVVCIVNHDVAPGAPGYVETVNDAAAGWTHLGYTAGSAYDMEYDAAGGKLALAVSGAGAVCAGLIVIDVRKELPELENNICNMLKPNPDYLKSTALRSTEDVVGVGGYVRYVRRWRTRWLTWTLCKLVSPGTTRMFWQLGSFSTDGSYAVHFQYGFTPRTIDTTASGGCWATAVEFPAWGHWDRVEDDEVPIYGTTDAFYGDPVSAFDNVTAMRVCGDDLLICTSPSRAMQIDFGAEPCIFRINIPALIAGERPQIGTATVVVPSSQGGATGFPNDQGVDAGVKKTAVVLTAVAPCYVEVGAVQSHIGVPSGYDYGDAEYVETNYGTSVKGGYAVRSGGRKQWRLAVFQDGGGISVGMAWNAYHQQDEFQLRWSISVRPLIAGLVECIGAHSSDPIVIPGDDSRITTQTVALSPGGGGSASFNFARKMFPGDEHATVGDCVYEAGETPAADDYVFSVADKTGAGAGLWISTGSSDSNRITRLTSADSSLAHDCVGAVEPMGSGYFAVVSHNSGASAASVQFMRPAGRFFSDRRYDAALGYSNCATGGVFFDTRVSRAGFCTVNSVSSTGEIWFFSGGASHDIRVWWDGTDPDSVMGEGASGAADSFGRPASFSSPAWSQSKGVSSYRFSFRVHGSHYLPGARSPFNENGGLPGSYSGVLADATRINVERGVWDGSGWAWLQEGQTFIVKSPSEAAAGAATMDVDALGAISLLVTRATYGGLHKPDVTAFAAAALATEDFLTYYHEANGARVREWALTPAPVVSIDGAPSSSYTIDASSGAVTFPASMEGKAVTADFSAYDPGTNEAEDIIKCILTYPEELGGCGLDESYITRVLTGVELATSDYLRYSFPKKNLRPSDPVNAIYRDGARITSGFTWDERAGCVTFDASQAGRAITGDAAYYTIQASGVTLPPMNFTPRSQENSYKAIQEVCRRVAPNYILREGRDGKIECAYFTQKAEGDEDVLIEDSDIVITSLSGNPAYEGLATRVLSFGQARLEELPNLCLGRPVTDLWRFGWHEGSSVQSVTDGSPYTGATGGYGRWDKDGGTTGAVQEALSLAPDGEPALAIDLGESREVATIIVARPSQSANEGSSDLGMAQLMSVWVSDDGADYSQIVAPFDISPGANISFQAGDDFEEGLRFRYIRINIHSLGLYYWEGHIDSQVGISEVQCYENKIIMGEARLQSDDPDAPLYDRWGLLEKYGIMTHVARGCSPDEALYTKEKADLDARHTLEEIVRLASVVGVESPCLPGVPVFSTVRVVNAALGVDVSFFVEGRAAREQGDSYTGAVLP